MVPTYPGGIAESKELMADRSKRPVVRQDSQDDQDIIFFAFPKERHKQEIC